MAATTQQQQANAWRARRRAASVAAPTSASGRKKVFSGHDLDQMHHRKSSRGQPERDSDRPAGELQARSGGGGLVGPHTATESLDHQLGQEVNRKSQAASAGSPTRRRLAPSRLPRRKFRVRVPLEEVRERWARVKASEASKMGVLRAKSRADSAGGQPAFDSARMASTKSQPNLKEARDDEEAAASSYVLLYEVNKGLAGQTSARQSGKLAAQEGTGGRRRVSAAQPAAPSWCHRKLVRIVDVRTLKRTLSLPETVLYSNDLLKRFNILKL